MNKNPMDYLKKLKDQTEIEGLKASAPSYEAKVAANTLLENITGVSMKEFAPKQSEVYSRNINIDVNDDSFLYDGLDVDLDAMKTQEYNNKLQRELNEGVNRQKQQKNSSYKSYDNDFNMNEFDNAFGGNSYQQPKQQQRQQYNEQNSNDNSELLKTLIKEVQSLKKIVLQQENVINERALVKGKEIARKYLLEQKNKKLIK